MPEPLWEAAVAVAREHGVYAASQSLRVRYESLKARLAGETTANRSKPAAAAKFVELGPAMSFAGGPGGASVELTDGDGTKLAIRLPVGDPLDLVGLAREFWSRRA